MTDQEIAAAEEMSPGRGWTVVEDWARPSDEQERADNPMLAVKVLRADDGETLRFERSVPIWEEP